MAWTPVSQCLLSEGWITKSRGQTVERDPPKSYTTVYFWLLPSLTSWTWTKSADRTVAIVVNLAEANSEAKRTR